jgi:hypothetical protein
MVGASLRNQEDTMKLITRFQAATLSTADLRGLYREIFNELARSEPDSPERRNALASLENIQAELALR